MAQGPRVRVLSYNVHGLHDDVDALAAVVTAAAPDVAVLQEGPRRLRWRARCAELARRLGMVVAGGGLPALGNLVLTSVRVRVHEQWTVQYPLTPGRHMRGAVFVRCSVGRSPFVVAGSHLATDAAERPTQATVLKKQLTDVEAPVVLGIDVNETSGGSAWRTLADGLVDPAAVTGQEGRATFPSAAPDRRIDAILVDSRLTVLGYAVIDSAEARRASDHLAVRADLALPVAAPAGDLPGWTTAGR
jgi:endonuclease/exonuclease/phosphatase family metal-dependent hydrolase